MWGRGQRNKVMKYGAPESPLSMGPKRPRYATEYHYRQQELRCAYLAPTKDTDTSASNREGRYFRMQLLAKAILMLFSSLSCSKQT